MRPVPATRAPRSPSPLPASSSWLISLFALYSGWYVRRHFHSVRITASGDAPGRGGSGSPRSRVVYVNHPSWWDPLICLLLHRRFFPRSAGFAPIDAEALRKYPFLERLGFFPVERSSFRGASHFLRTAQAILAVPGNILWLTPQGRFADVRERPPGLEAGIGHLAAHLARACSRNTTCPVEFQPLALEYTHWEERLPEALAHFGSPSIPEEIARTPESWTEAFSRTLEQTQDQLALLASRRATDAFRPLLEGATGVGGVYDAWRRLKALVRHAPFDPHHGRL